MHDGEQITAIKNRILAQHQKQSSLTDKSECKFLKSTRFKCCTALKWSTKNWTCAGFYADHFCRYRMFSRGNGESKSKSFQCNTLGWPQFEWFLKHFDPSANVEVMEIPIAICDSCLANNAAFSALRSHNDWLKTRYLWERIVSFSTLRLFVLFWRTEKSIYESLKIFSSKTKFSWKSFHQSQKWPKRYFCWTTKLPWLMFFIELRASFLRFNSFMRINLRCSFFRKRIDKDFLWKIVHRFWKQFWKNADLD